nr:MAG TPA: hypothetical protein [Caudoviricetes sp.]
MLCRILLVSLKLLMLILLLICRIQTLFLSN